MTPDGKNRSGRRSARTPTRTLRWGGIVSLLLAAVIVTWGLGQRGPELPPDFTLVAYDGQERLGGDEVRFHQIVGQGTPVVLNFWAASCPPCREEMPGFQQVADLYGDELLILGVDVGTFTFLGTHDEARAFLEAYEIHYPTAYAVDGSVVRDYEVRGMPTTVFFDANGRTVAKHTGFLPMQEFYAEVDALVRGGN